MHVEHLGFAPDYVDYLRAWDQQRAIHAAVVDGRAPDTVLLLEHAPTYTAGKRTEPHERPLDGTPVIDVDRGGKITWHGPGQLVGYPIVRLPDPMDVVSHVRRLEEVMMAICADLGLETIRVPGRSGVWLPADPGPRPGVSPEVGALLGPRPERKVGAVGVRVSRGVTMHGFALNISCDLSWGRVIVPCGISDAGVTNLEDEIGRHVTVADVVPLAHAHLARVLAPGSRQSSRPDQHHGATPVTAYAGAASLAHPHHDTGGKIA